MAPALRLGAIPATSPTLAEIMRTCFLRASLSRASGVSEYVLGNPKAWIGTAYHFVLEKILDVDLTIESFSNAVDRLWREGIEIQYRRTATHQLDRRFGPPETWPGYHLAKASARLRARDLVRSAERPAIVPAGSLPPDVPKPVMRERQLSACDGKLVGKPDVISGDEVIDYKSGAITEYDEDAQADAIKPAYARQLRIYGYLVKQAFGWWPARGRVMPFAGPSVEVSLEPSLCVDEALEAVRLLDGYNATVEHGDAAMQLAAPAPAICKWCPYKTMCPGFWQEVSTKWSGQLDGAAIEGTVSAAPRPIHGGAAFALSMNVDAGTEEHCLAEVAPLSPEVHPVVSSLSEGERIRIVGAWVRPGITIVPTSRTILTRAGEVPQLILLRS